MRQIHTLISACRTAVEGGFELSFVYPDGDVGLAEVLETSGVVQVEMADDDLLYVLDVVAGLGDSCFQLVFRLKAIASKDVIDGSAPDLCETEETRTRGCGKSVSTQKKKIFIPESRRILTYRDNPCRNQSPTR